MAYDYSCVMFKCNFKDWQKITSQIKEEDLYIDEDEMIFGVEDEPHTTLLFGIHEDIPMEQIVSEVSKYPKIEISIGGVSTFENGKYDVVKFDVISPDLHKLRKRIVSKLENTQQFPDYKPHITIAYVKAGKGKKYKYNGKGSKLFCDTIMISTPDGEKREIKLR
jgi:2'-5' RNA ligase